MKELDSCCYSISGFRIYEDVVDENLGGYLVMFLFHLLCLKRI